MEEWVYTINRNAEILLQACKETGLKVTPGETQYIYMNMTHKTKISNKVTI
jgi:hypothetical protein